MTPPQPRTAVPAPSDETAYEPPAVHLVWCPECGRNDRYTTLSLTGKHYVDGKRCHGVPVRLTYELVGGVPS